MGVPVSERMTQERAREIVDAEREQVRARIIERAQHVATTLYLLHGDLEDAIKGGVEGIDAVFDRLIAYRTNSDGNMIIDEARELCREVWNYRELYRGMHGEVNEEGHLVYAPDEVPDENEMPEGGEAGG